MERKSSLPYSQVPTMRCAKYQIYFWNRTLHVSDCLLAVSGWNQFHPDPASKQSAWPVWHKPIAVYTVLDSWWWTENMSETCTVLFQKWIWELVHLVGFIIRTIYCTALFVCWLFLQHVSAGLNIYWLLLAFCGYIIVVRKMCNFKFTKHISLC